MSGTGEASDEGREDGQQLVGRDCLGPQRPRQQSAEAGSYLRLIDFVYQSTLGLGAASASAIWRHHPPVRVSNLLLLLLLHSRYRS